ncbi:MAG: post-transcriptional regulator [Bacilli bacterium]|nr:post-transcriptional regulator [Bacilli bacterium]
MEDINIKSQKELFVRIKPALRCKKHELMAQGINYITEIDIWNYNKNNIWINKNGLTLAEIVNGILNTPNQEYEKYVIKKINAKEDVI